MTIVNVVLELEYDDCTVDGLIAENHTVDILINKTVFEIEQMLEVEETALADFISDNVGYCVNEIISYKEADYIIN